MTRGASASLFRIAQRQPFSMKGFVFSGEGGFWGTVETDVVNWPSLRKITQKRQSRACTKLWTKIKRAVLFHRPGFGIIYACRHTGVTQYVYCRLSVVLTTHRLSKCWLSKAKKVVIIFNLKTKVSWMSFWFEVCWCSCLLVSLASSHVCEVPQGYTLSSANSGFYSFLAKSVAPLVFDAPVPFSQLQLWHFLLAINSLKCYKPLIVFLERNAVRPLIRSRPQALCDWFGWFHTATRLR